MKLRHLIIGAICSVTIIFSSCSEGPERQEKNDYDPVVGAYIFPGNSILNPGEIRGDMLTHIFFSFANLSANKMIEGHEADSANLAILTGLRHDYPDLKILIAVGGWSWSGGFSDMALYPETRQEFVESAVDFILRHDLDGIDLDWEYPGLPGDNNPHRPEDKQNFTYLIRELRERLDMEGGAEKQYELTIAAGAFQAYLDNTEMHLVQEYLDFINLMTYDFTGEWAPVADHHTNLFPSSQTDGTNSVAGSVDLFLDAGVPANKIVIGAAFYGRGWQEVNPENNGLGQPGLGLQPAGQSYRQIKERYFDDNAYQMLWDNEAMASYLWSAEERTFVSFDCPGSVREKVIFLKDQNLRGIMFWQYLADYEHELLQAIYSAMGQN